MSLVVALTLYGLCAISLLAVMLLGPSFPDTPLGQAYQCLADKLPKGIRRDLTIENCYIRDSQLHGFTDETTEVTIRIIQEFC